jgi:hypothetical protein
MAKTNAKPIQNDFWFCKNIKIPLIIVVIVPLSDVFCQIRAKH